MRGGNLVENHLSFATMFDASLLVSLLLYAIGLMILYWVIRLAVRHALRDAEEGRR